LSVGVVVAGDDGGASTADDGGIAVAGADMPGCSTAGAGGIADGCRHAGLLLRWGCRLFFAHDRS
jgi:hypothetical protein